MAEHAANNRVCIRALVRGTVQGVFFRASTKSKADELGVTGWVRNRSDGSVEFLAQGEASAVNVLVEWARQGPPMACVTELVVDASGSMTPDVEVLHAFEVRRTER
jgi:acylphosphatase